MCPVVRLSFIRFALILVLPVAVGAITACSNGTNGDGTITVFAAASLTDAFEEIAEDFEAANPGVDVKLNFAGSQRLRSQAELGAAADVLASADDLQMELAKDAGLIEGESRHFASTSLAVIAHGDSGIEILEDLTAQGRKLVIAHESVPAGQYSRALLRTLSSPDGGPGPEFSERVLANVVSEEPSVKFVEQKVVLGQADAGIVYRPGAITAAASGAVREVPLTEMANDIRARYPIAVMEGSAEPELALQFVEFVLSPPALDILAVYGFAAP